LPQNTGLNVGYLLLIAGIIEGAMLLGWRLTQLPKTQALEFLLVSPLRPPLVFLGEALVGFSQLLLVTLSGLPLLALLRVRGFLQPLDLAPLLIMPCTWGAITGLGLTVWAYEPETVRRWAERILLVLTSVYLVVGVLAGEHLATWLRWLPGGLGLLFVNGVEAFHRYNPFAVVQFWFQEPVYVSGERMLAVEIVALLAVGLLLLRTAVRLQGHFHERHYQPAVSGRHNRRATPGDQPLSWWAVRRVTQYSGRVNLWLAAGFGCLYALYTLAGPRWPHWLGKSVFAIFDNTGGVPVWAAALVVLAAVPAAFQYGLWDSNAQDRCRRLELLLLTRLGAADYWQAAAIAAWRRGRGYFAVAVLLWAAAAVAGSLSVVQAVAALGTAVLLWGFYFALGFRAFSRGAEANLLGLGLTLGLPLVVLVLWQLGWPALVSILPPGTVYCAAGRTPGWTWALGAILNGLLVLVVSRRGLANCELQLRRWYDKHHGPVVLD
jgi:hypothetical protein